MFSPSPQPSPAGRESPAKPVSFGSFSLREKVAEGRMRVNLRMFLRKGRCSIAGLIIIAVTLGSAKAVAADWPQLLGPRADGTSSETGLLSAWPSGGPKVIWKKQIGTGYSAPSIRDGHLVLFHRIANEQIVEALDAKTAKPVWRHASPTRYRDPFGYNNGPRCTPLLTEKHCYTFGAEGVLLCLNVKTGKPVWQRKTAEEFQVTEAFFGVGASPVIEGDLLIVMVGGQPNSTIVAFDKDTGKDGVAERGPRHVAEQAGDRLARRTARPLARHRETRKLRHTHAGYDPRQTHAP